VHLRTLISSVLLFCGSIAVAAEPSSALSIYQNSSAEIRSELIAKQIKKSYLNTGISVKNNDERIRNKILDAIDNAYRPSLFEREILRAIEQTMSPLEQAQVVKWLDTRVGRDASLKEALAYMDATDRDITSSIMMARTFSIKNNKDKLLKTVDIAAMASDIQLDITVSLTAASSYAANAPFSVSSNDYSIFYGATNERRGEIEGLNSNYTMELLTDSYASLGSKDLKSVISFWGSPAGFQYAAALRTGMNRALNSAGDHFSKEVAYIIANRDISVAEFE